MKLLAIALILIGPSLVHAFPENVRHGYGNCTTCHTSPTGGGVLSAYGRELSKEIQSTWSGEKEHLFMYFLNSPEWLDLGGDVRSVQTFKNTKDYVEAKYILMQWDFEAAATYKNLVAVVSAGLDTDERPIDGAVSRKHYLMYRLTDSIALRAGRFMRAYGINLADHIAFVKRGLGFDQSRETYNLEGSYITENWNWILTGSMGRPDSSKVIAEKGVSLSTSYFLNESYKIGPSFLYGTDQTSSRELMGLNGIFTWNKKLAFLTEWDLQHKKTKQGVPSAVNNGWGFATFNRVAYEVVQGFNPFIVAEVSRLNFKNAASSQKSFGAGFMFYPRPHLDFQLQYLKQQRGITTKSYDDYVNTVLHFYF